MNTVHVRVCGIIYQVQRKKISLSASLIYCTFQKHANSEVQRPTDNIQKIMWFVICDWWISICVVCFHVSRFVACECNYD